MALKCDPSTFRAELSEDTHITYEEYQTLLRQSSHLGNNDAEQLALENSRR